jgi:hypothetical protein
MAKGPVNTTEEFVLRICRKSLLSLWCNCNPLGKNLWKELCDFLVVCDPHIIIVSVKDVQFQEHKERTAASERWNRKAIDESVKQIYGAERWLATAPHVIRSNGLPGLRLPEPEVRRIHRIAVAFGGKGEVPIKSGKFGKGYVHVMSESAFEHILTELDTITDLIGYLTAKEGSSPRLVLGGECNLLGCYLLNNKALPTDVDFLLVDETHWEGLRERDDYKRKKKADEVSYYWDRLIESYTGPNGELLDTPGLDFTEFEFALRTMAREDRFNRRILGGGLVEFLDAALGGALRARFMSSPSGVIYVPMLFKPTEDKERRCTLLAQRCAFARHGVGKGDIVIGIAFIENEIGVASVRELLHFDARNWTAGDDERAAQQKAALNYDSFTAMRKVDELEYPTED